MLQRPATSAPGQPRLSAGLETVRAFVVFGLLFSILGGISSQLAFRALDLGILERSLNLGRDEAQRIARAIEVVGLQDEALNFGLVRAKRDVLERYIYSRIQNKRFIDHVEVFDRLGVQQLAVLRASGPATPETAASLGFVPRDWPAADDAVVRQFIGGTQGEVRVTLSPEPIVEELRLLRDSLRFKIAAAAVIGGATLIAGFFYVLYMIRRNRSLEQSRQSAARASYIGLLASGLAHEIRNPLNAMNMNLQMLEEDLDTAGAVDEDNRELLDSTKSEIKRLERLVNNFLAYARPSPPRYEAKDLNSVVGEVVRLLDNDFRQSGVQLIQDGAAMLPSVEIDDAQFKQALINLMVNARQVLKDGGQVRVVTRAGAGGEIVLEVIDDGPGIPPETRERIFEVFYSSRGGGTGLGLPIARQVVERHGGSIEVDSEVGKGTTFRIRLPRRQPSSAATEVAL